MNNHLAIVMAAGKGTRMESDLPKVLVEVCGRPMIDYVLDALRAGGVTQVVVVVGYRAELVRAHLADRDQITFVEQTEQLGTGHAVMVCRDALADHLGAVLVVTGDSPMTQASSIRTMLSEFDRRAPSCLIGTTHKEDPTGLGRIVRDAEGRFEAIVEQKDATAAQQAITEVNMSTYVFSAPELLGALTQLRTDNSQGEYYITDVPAILKGAGKTVEALDVLQPCESLSINNMADLAVVEKTLLQSKSRSDS